METTTPISIGYNYTDIPPIFTIQIPSSTENYEWFVQSIATIVIPSLYEKQWKYTRNACFNYS